MILIWTRYAQNYHMSVMCISIHIRIIIHFASNNPHIFKFIWFTFDFVYLHLNYIIEYTYNTHMIHIWLLSHVAKFPMLYYVSWVHMFKLIVFTSYRRHKLDSCCRDKEDKPGPHRRLSLGGTVFHYHYDILLSEFGSARLNICTEMQICTCSVRRLDLHGTAGSIHHSRRISQESSERTNLQYSYTHCKGGRLRF